MNVQEFYENLMNLVSEPDSPFYFVNQEHNGFTYRIFSYRLASYTDFCKPFAREARGTMFEIDNGGNVLRIASMPPSKFFNYKENPFTMELDFSNVESITDKMDGSLISTFYENVGVFVKSKTSLYSEQAIAAQKYLDNDEALQTFCYKICAAGGTVNMEYTAPTNRIVLYYRQESLKVFGVRSKDGDDWTHRFIFDTMTTLQMDTDKYLVNNIADSVEHTQEFINSIPTMKDIEGYVVNIKNSERVKIKTDWYISLHHSKDSVNSDKRLFECVVNESQDDLKGIFFDDIWLIGRINNMEVKVKKILSELNVNVYEFYNLHRLMDRKSYAILGQQSLDQKYFGLAMSLYLGKELNVKGWLLKHYKDFNISDDIIEE